MTHQYIKYSVLLLVYCLISVSLEAKETLTFNYGGTKGTKHSAKLTVEYEIKSGKRTVDLQKTRNTIDLNLYKDPVYLSLKFNDLQVGLNKAADRLRHNDHHKIFYVEVQADASLPDILQAVKTPLKIAPPNSHYGLNETELHYLINPPAHFGKTFTVSTNLIVVDGVYNRKWQAKTLKKTFTIVPKADPCYHIKCKANEFCDGGKCFTNDPCSNIKCKAKEYCDNGKCISKSKNPCMNCKRGEVCVNGVCMLIEKATQLKTSEPNEVTILTETEQLWQLIQADSLNTDSTTLLYCKRYLEICHEQVSKDCERTDQVFCKQMELVTKDELIDLEQTYLEEFSEGQCTDWVLTNIQSRIPKITPGLAQLQFNDRALAVHKVVGGVTPYFVDFYNYTENNTLPVKRERFTAPNFLLEFKDAALDGSYHVQVVDNAGNPFTEKRKIEIPVSVNLSKSVVALSVMLILMGLSRLYKKYVHF